MDEGTDAGSGAGHGRDEAARAEAACGPDRKPDGVMPTPGETKRIAFWVVGIVVALGLTGVGGFAVATFRNIGSPPAVNVTVSATPAAGAINARDRAILEGELELETKHNQTLVNIVLASLATVGSVAFALIAYSWFSSTRLADHERAQLRREISIEREQAQREIDERIAEIRRDARNDLVRSTRMSLMLSVLQANTSTEGGDWVLSMQRLCECVEYPAINIEATNDHFRSFHPSAISGEEWRRLLVAFEQAMEEGVQAELPRPLADEDYKRIVRAIAVVTNVPGLQLETEIFLRGLKRLERTADSWDQDLRPPAIAANQPP